MNFLAKRSWILLPTLLLAACDAPVEIKVDSLFEANMEPYLVAGADMGDASSPIGPSVADSVRIATDEGASRDEVLELAGREFAFVHRLSQTWHLPGAGGGTRPRTASHPDELQCSARAYGVVAEMISDQRSGLETYLAGHRIDRIELGQFLMSFDHYDTEYLGLATFDATGVDGGSLFLTLKYGRDLQCPSEQEIADGIAAVTQVPYGVTSGSRVADSVRDSLRFDANLIVTFLRRIRLRSR